MFSILCFIKMKSHSDRFYSEIPISIVRMFKILRDLPNFAKASLHWSLLFVEYIKCYKWEDFWCDKWRFRIWAFDIYLTLEYKRTNDQSMKHHNTAALLQNCKPTHQLWNASHNRCKQKPTFEKFEMNDVRIFECHWCWQMSWCGQYNHKICCCCGWKSQNITVKSLNLIFRPVHLCN